MHFSKTIQLSIAIFSLLSPHSARLSAARLSAAEDGCKVSLSFCIEADTLVDTDSLENTRRLLRATYSFASARLSAPFVPAAAFVYGAAGGGAGRGVEARQLFDYRSFFLGEDFAAALQRVPRSPAAERLFAQDAQRGAEQCVERAARLPPPYAANNVIAVVSRHSVNAARLSGLPEAYAAVAVAAAGDGFSAVDGFLAAACGGGAGSTCGEPTVFGVRKDTCSGHMARDTCLLACPAPYSNERRVIECVAGTGWVIDERCRDTFDWLTILLITILTLLSLIPFALNVRHVIRTKRTAAGHRRKKVTIRKPAELRPKKSPPPLDELMAPPGNGIREMLLYDN